MAYVFPSIDPSSQAVNPGDFSGALSVFGQVNSFPDYIGNSAGGGPASIGITPSVLTGRFSQSDFASQYPGIAILPTTVSGSLPQSGTANVDLGSADPRNAPGTGFLSWLDPTRLITVALGLLLVFGGLYLLGTSSVADSLKSIAKGAVA